MQNLANNYAELSTLHVIVFQLMHVRTCSLHFISFEHSCGMLFIPTPLSPVVMTGGCHSRELP